jgi:LacI family transcriptional regulator
MARLKDIAAATQLTEATVSRVLRGVGQWSQETRDRVFQAADELKYRPNMLVQGLRTGRTQSLGVVLPGLDAHDGVLLQAIHDELVAHDYIPYVLLTTRNPERNPDRQAYERQQLRRLIDRRVDAVLVVPAAFAVFDQSLQEVWSRKIPLVLMMGELDLEQADFIGINEYRGGQMLAEHLLAQGHRRIGHVVAPQNVSGYRQRAAGFRSVFDSRPDLTLLEVDSEDSYHAQPQIARLLDQAAASGTQITALFTDNDFLAMEAYQVLTARGLRIPHDIAMCTYGDAGAGKHRQLSITSLHLPIAQVGEHAVRLALQRFDQKHLARGPRQVNRLEPSLVVRDSTQRTGAEP